ncbi:hypothetical protein [uncultured Phocaeicola sp.]|jgi:hypothetical protein|nr:hypothetical protein [uncultured Phocaeicola sp.]
MKYLKRSADKLLSDHLGALGTVLIEGPNGAANLSLLNTLPKAL